MSVEKVKRKTGQVYRVRWREGGRNRARTFDRHGDAARWDAEVRRRSQLGTLHLLDAGSETLDQYVTGTWASAHLAHLAPKTRQHYAGLYDHHIAPFLGSAPLRALTPERVARWQSDRLKAGAGRVALRQAFELLGTILQRAVESQRIATNPTRLVRKAPRPRREETRPLAPATVEAMRAFFLAGVPVVAPAGVRARCCGGGPRARTTLRPAPQLRFAVAARRAERHLRSAPAGARRAPHAHPVRARHRRARARPEALRGRRDSGCSRG
ncbi:MAG: hypothetical protein QOD65_1052 [Gaiellales bacterium]|nr:hypothetical protein [Gaiellales bacterium]MEA2168275.1 hypothetical protein [Solirubrobacteraceae bacterium]